jgi:phenylacetate-coenzyme A ligase PaaK-like adenylate-forming protein
MTEERYKDKIFSLRGDDDFAEAALWLFRHQAEHNPVYHAYLEALQIQIRSVKQVRDIPFLPISFFKTHQVVTGNFHPEAVFRSSGTTSTTQSQHFVKELAVYQRSFTQGFEMFYKKPGDLAILALLPSYLERNDSSLVYMAHNFINQSRYPESGFFLNNHQDLLQSLHQLAQKAIPTLLLGVSFALLDLAALVQDFYHPDLIVMETGGMKGRKREMIRTELHQLLTDAFNVETIHSEYGMTELMSQAYSKGQGLYHPVPWMQVLVRDVADPLSLIEDGKTGGINIIDLANMHSCAFLATEDLGKVYSDGTFEILGRFDQAEIRGCNLMVT